MGCVANDPRNATWHHLVANDLYERHKLASACALVQHNTAPQHTCLELSVVYAQPSRIPTIHFPVYKARQSVQRIIHRVSNKDRATNALNS